MHIAKTTVHDNNQNSPLQSLVLQNYLIKPLLVFLSYLHQIHILEKQFRSQFNYFVFLFRPVLEVAIEN